MRLSLSCWLVECAQGMDKETRLNYGESLMTHAMVFTAFDKEDDAELPSKWRVENSWGRDAADSGYYVRLPPFPKRCPANG